MGELPCLFGIVVTLSVRNRPKKVWRIRTRLQVSGLARDFAPFNRAIDSKLRGCDLTSRTRHST